MNSVLVWHPQLLSLVIADAVLAAISMVAAKETADDARNGSPPLNTAT
jgi:hypothetical protein